MSNEVAGVETQIGSVIRLAAVGSADFDVVEFDQGGRAGLDVDFRQRAALLVGDHQTVQTDDRGPASRRKLS